METAKPTCSIWESSELASRKYSEYLSSGDTW